MSSASIRSRKVSDLYCPSCGQSQYFEELDRAIRTIACTVGGKNCFEGYSWEFMNEQHLMFDAEDTLSYTWWHATSVNNWFAKINDLGGQNFVHIGSLDSALARAGHVYEYQDFWLYPLTISSQGAFSSVAVEDQNDWEGLGLGTRNCFHDFDVVPYVNMVEAPGDLSLVVRARFLELAGKPIYIDDFVGENGYMYDDLLRYV